MKSKIYMMICVISMMIFTSIFAPTAVNAADNPLSIVVEQTINTSSSTAASATFQYKLHPIETDIPMPRGRLVENDYLFTITGTNNKEIVTIEYSRPGIYHYELSQSIDKIEPGWIYDNRSYTVEVHVEPDLEVSLIVINLDGTKASRIEFENRYYVSPSDPSLMVDPPVKKTVTGNPSKTSIFTFRLQARDLSYPMPPGSQNGVKELTILGSGEEDFGVWSYTKEGIYFYTIYEVKDGDKNYVYDTVVYTITDTVTDKDGQLVLSREVKNNEKQMVTTLSFTNKYQPATGGRWSPFTGDISRAVYFYILIAVSGAALIGAIILLMISKKHKNFYK